MPPTALILDVLLLIFLVLVLFYAIKLNRALRLLQSDSRGLEGRLREFADATASAQHAVLQLRNIGSAESERLKILADRATTIRDDLKYLIERAERSADRVELSSSSGFSKPNGRGAQPFPPGRQTETTEPRHNFASDGASPLPSSRRNQATPEDGYSSTPADAEARSARAIAREQILNAMKNVR
ncbi:MAG: hypothetical protein K0U36_01735 [Alphaproteobacteria bacterium]|nr:hypothetical protein [Alphaproteobacteria bacterium]